MFPVAWAFLQLVGPSGTVGAKRFTHSLADASACSSASAHPCIVRRLRVHSRARTTTCAHIAFDVVRDYRCRRLHRSDYTTVQPLHCMAQ
jgi:hypothetical protein